MAATITTSTAPTKPPAMPAEALPIAAPATTPAGHKRNTIRFFESIFLKHPIASKKLVTDETPKGVRKTLNMDHEVWTNPWNKSMASAASFLELYKQTLKKCNIIYYHLNVLLVSEAPLHEQNWEPFLGELGNYSYHSGLDAGRY